MVISDWDPRSRPPQLELTLETRADARARLARPRDRLAAVIIDVVILLGPLYLLLVSPLKRVLMAGFLLNSEPDLFISISLMVSMAVAFILAYQTVAHYLFGATVGKRILGIRVIPMFADDTLTFWECFSRSVIWIVEGMLLGLPWLAVFANVRRRSWHDRVSDSIVVTTGGSGAPLPEPWERGLVRAVFGAALVAALLTGGYLIVQTWHSLKLERAFNGGLPTTETCEIVAETVEDSEDDEHARIRGALALYAAGLADRSCLEAEVERESATQVPVGALTYLAQAFVHADDGQVSNSYLEKVCEEAPDSVECAMSQLVTSWSEGNWPDVERVLHAAPEGSGYMEVWGVRHYMKQARYPEALAMLDRLVDRRELAEFSLVQRVKALVNSYRDEESAVALKQASLALSQEKSRELNTWVCVQNLQNGCSALQDSIACRVLSDEAPESLNFSDPSAVLAGVMQKECMGHADYLSWIEMARDRNWRDFFFANLKRARSDRAAAASLFAGVMSSDRAPEILRVEAARRWMQFATTVQMDQVIELWHGLDAKESWVKAGNLLLTRLAESRQADRTLIVARGLTESGFLSPASRAALRGFADVEPGDRRPASEPLRDQVRNMLENLEEAD